MLGALSVLQSTLKTTGGATSSYSNRIVYLALAGEPWGYMGSRRLLYEASTGSNNTVGLDLSLIEKVRTVGVAHCILTGCFGASMDGLFLSMANQL